MIVKGKTKYKAHLETGVLMLATFFNPLGFDALFAYTMKLTGSYWITDAIFYLVSASLFTVYYLLKKRSKNQLESDSSSSEKSNPSSL